MSAIDSAGNIINTTAPEKIDQAFQPLLMRLIEALKQAFGETLHSAYLYGSIAEGRARPGDSDADCLVVLLPEAVPYEARLAEIARAVHAEFSTMVCKVDLPAITLPELMSPEQLMGCGAYLKILGLPICGEDLRSALPAFRPSLALANGWNGDLRPSVATAHQLLQSGATESEKRLTMRAISAKAVRSFFMLLAAESQVWTTHFQQQTMSVLDYFPEQAEVLGYLAEARSGHKPLGEFAALLSVFSETCLPVFEARLATDQQAQGPDV